MKLKILSLVFLFALPAAAQLPRTLSACRADLDGFGILKYCESIERPNTYWVEGSGSGSVASHASPGQGIFIHVSKTKGCEILGNFNEDPRNQKPDTFVSLREGNLVFRLDAKGVLSAIDVRTKQVLETEKFRCRSR